MAAADTNVVLRLLLRDDEAQYAAAAELLEQGPLLLTHVVLAEVAWVLTSAYRVDKADLCDALDALLGVAGFAVDEPQAVREAIETHRASRADFSDCLILAIARARGALPLATFDERLGRLPGAQRLRARGPGSR